VWPPVIDERLRLTPGQLELLIEGMDWRRTVAIEVEKRPALA
jgi:transposase